MNRPLFIVGFPRSGTTLIRSILSQHSKISLVNEPELICGLISVGYSCSDLVPITEDLIDKLRQTTGMCRQYLDGLDRSYLERLLHDPAPLPFKTVYEKLLQVSSMDIVWGEKSLHNSFYVQDLSQIYPDALWVNVVRDARSCVLSKFIKDQLKRNRAENPETVVDNSHWSANFTVFAKQAAYWAAWQETFNTLTLKYLRPSQLVNIKYEDFLIDPKSHLMQICSKLELPFEESMLDAKLRKKDPVLSSSSSYAHQNISKELDTSRINAYMEMPPELIKVVESYTRKQLRQYGYSQSEQKIPLVSQAILLLMLRIHALKIKKFVSEKLSRRGSSYGGILQDRATMTADKPVTS